MVAFHINSVGLSMSSALVRLLMFPRLVGHGSHAYIQNAPPVSLLAL